MNKGFTLIEVLIGLFIAVIASISVAQVIASTNKVVEAGRKTFVATNLAHEGLELTRQLRDNAWFSGSPKTNWVSASSPKLCPDAQVNTYTIDANSALGNTINSGDAKNELYYHSDSGLWTTVKQGGVDSGYARVMQIDCSQASADPAYVTVTSTVSWSGTNGVKNVSLKELLYNWLP